MKMYYQKQYIDAMHNVKLASNLVSVVQDQVKQAGSDLDAAKKSEVVYNRSLRSNELYEANNAELDTKTAMRFAVKGQMEDAYMASSVGRTANNTPPYGDENPLFPLPQ